VLRLRFWRLAQGLTQVEAARRLRMSHLTLSYLETGRLKPAGSDLERLRRAFGDQAERLFDEIGDGLAAVRP
jgi:transcriptional regulator with XRE-family HTH domain